MHHTLVGPDGSVLNVELRTNNDSYNIFLDHPSNSEQTVMAGPGAGNAESPIGWLSGGQKSINIGGNNVHAYLDTDRNNRPDKGGSRVNDGNFLAQADLTQEPNTAENQATAVQNLFYFNNIIHDKLYRHGFTESAGNFQNDNFVNGGLGGDAVNAEAQDGLGYNNANFATPPDGGNGRMQMFLWIPTADYLVVLPGDSFFLAQGATFGPSLDNNPLADEPFAVADDGDAAEGTSTSDACQPVTNNVEGAIVLIDRGNCDFDVKVKNAQLAGAVGVIVANSVSDDLVLMGGDTITDGVTIVIPAVFIGQSDGVSLRTLLPPTVTLRANPLRDGDVDSDIIYHEYGHGLTWRMIGSMGDAMSGAIGEGMGDVLSILMNEDDVVGEYSTGDPGGIRSAPYTGYPRTYGDFTGTSVHLDGEIYAAIIWQLWQLFQAETIAINKDTLFDYLIGGMNFTPAGPAFEDMRDGILMAAAGSGDECLIWEAFAQFGVGVGAQYDGSIVIPSPVVPAVCDGSTTVVDAAIASITVNTLPAVNGVANTVTVRVSNTGNVDIGSFSVTLTDNTVPVEPAQIVGALDPGQWADVIFNWTPVGAVNHHLVASHNLAGDINAANNTASTDVPVTDPTAGPVMVSILPNSMEVAISTEQEVTIAGSGFEGDPGDVSVSFTNGSGPAPVTSVISVTSTAIVAIVTPKAKGKKGTSVWDVVLTTSNGSDVLLGAFSIIR